MIAADAPDAWVSHFVASRVPVADAFGLHALGGLLLTAVGLAYIVYLALTGLDRRFAIPPERQAAARRHGGRLAWQLRNVQVYRTLFALIGVLAASGFVLYFDMDLVAHAVSWTIQQAHLAAAWALVALIAVHVVAQYMVGAAGRGGRNATRAGVDWVLKMFRPRVAQIAGMPAEPSPAGAVLARFGVTLEQVLMYLVGCVLFSLGVKLFITAELGLDPLHSMAIGIIAALGIANVGIGSVVTVVTLLLLGLWSLWTRRLPPWSTLVTMILVGYLVDFWNQVGLERWLVTALTPQTMMLTGIVLDVYASVLIVMSGIGLRVMDLWAVSLSHRWRVPFVLGKFVFEAAFVAVSAWLGGPLGPATIAFVVLVGIVAQPALWANRSLLRLPDYGLGRRAFRA